MDTNIYMDTNTHMDTDTHTFQKSLQLHIRYVAIATRDVTEV